MDRGDTRCKYGKTVTPAFLRPDAECAMNNNGFPGPCMYCVTPEFEEAEKMDLTIALNAIDFTNPVTFITYGQAIKLDASFLDENLQADGTRRRRSSVALTAKNNTALPRIIIAAH